jgi:hypothetical protein
MNKCLFFSDNANTSDLGSDIWSRITQIYVNGGFLNIDNCIFQRSDISGHAGQGGGGNVEMRSHIHIQDGYPDPLSQNGAYYTNARITNTRFTNLGGEDDQAGNINNYTQNSAIYYGFVDYSLSYDPYLLISNCFFGRFPYYSGTQAVTPYSNRTEMFNGGYCIWNANRSVNELKIEYVSRSIHNYLSGDEVEYISPYLSPSKTAELSGLANSYPEIGKTGYGMLEGYYTLAWPYNIGRTT